MTDPTAGTRPRTLIVGASRGVGRACAHALAGQGHALALAYATNTDAARAVAEEVGGATLIRGDVAVEAPVMVEQAVETLGGLDNLVVTAVPVITGRLVEMAEEDAQRLYDVTVTGFRRAVLAARPHLAGSGGCAVALSSLGAHRYASYYGALGPAKAALESLVAYLAAELGRDGIRVNAVSPCLIDDPQHLAESPELRPFLDAAAKRTPLGRRLVTPDDVAGVIRALVGPDMRAVTGQTVVVDGGYSLLA